MNTSIFSPVILAFLATIFTWLMTALGASTIFLTRKFSRRLLDASLGFAAGIMTAASLCSLLIPALESSAGEGILSYFPVIIGFLGGCLFLAIVDKIIPHLHPRCDMGESRGIKTTWHRNRLLLIAVIIHNIPEGLAVGIAFGALTSNLPYNSIASAAALTIGIGIQNFPEGMAISFPLRGEGLSRRKSFWYGQLSGLVEIIAGVLGALLVTSFSPVIPYALSFAAGAMIFVVVDDIIPECQKEGNIKISIITALVGFIMMLLLDTMLG